MKKISRKILRDVIVEEALYISHPNIRYIASESHKMKLSGFNQSEINSFIHEGILKEKEEYETSAFIEYIKRRLADIIIAAIVDNVDGIIKGGFFYFIISETVPAVIMNTSFNHLKSIYSGEGAEALADILVDSIGDVITGPGLPRFADAMGLNINAEITKFLATSLANVFTQGEDSERIKQSIAKSIRSIDVSDIFPSFDIFDIKDKDIISSIPGIEMPEDPDDGRGID